MSKAPKPKILLVDDEVQVTRSLQMLLRRDFNVTTAGSGEEGIEIVRSGELFDIVVSDMRMPGIDGATFLTEVRAIVPDTVRILLTGQADIQSSVAAVNEGGVFRFLTKPCSPIALRRVLDEACEVRRLKDAESEVLGVTLCESVLVLADVLNVVHPVLARRSSAVRALVDAMIEAIEIPASWELDVAGALSHLGCITIPRRVIENVAKGRAHLSGGEATAWGLHPSLGSDLIKGIPRMDRVAAMIARQDTIPSPDEIALSPQDWDPIVLGGELIRLASAYTEVSAVTREHELCVETLRTEGSHSEALLDVLASLTLAEDSHAPVALFAANLRAGMILVDDLCSSDGAVLALAGTLVNATLLKLAQNFSSRGELKEPIRVRPSSSGRAPSARTTES